MNRRLAYLLGAAAVAASSWSLSLKAADHGDSPSVAASPATDINDVYAWMHDASGAEPTLLNLAMTLYRDVPAGTGFSPSAQYVFHVTKHPAWGMPAAGETLVLCNFAPNGRGQCWVGPATGGSPLDYVGDIQPDVAAGTTSASGKVKVFAGARNDPFFFNLAGFQTVATAVTETLEAGGVTPNAQGCPALDTPTATYLRTQLASAPFDPGTTAPPPEDAFAAQNVLSIVVQLDKTLVSDAANPVIGVWASTNM